MEQIEPFANFNQNVGLCAQITLKKRSFMSLKSEKY